MNSTLIAAAIVSTTWESITAKAADMVQEAAIQLGFDNVISVLKYDLLGLKDKEVPEAMSEEETRKYIDANMEALMPKIEKYFSS